MLNVGDVIRMTHKDNSWRLSQIPKAEAGLVALNPQNGGILAIVGGFDFQNSKFNRITNAQRQPGSSFKPFIYSAALEKGYTLATVINDAPIVIENPDDNSLWRPQNDTHRFYGPTRLRDALVHSRNLVSIRLLGLIGAKLRGELRAAFWFFCFAITAGIITGAGNCNCHTTRYGFCLWCICQWRLSRLRLTLSTVSAIPRVKSLIRPNPRVACPSCATAARQAKPRQQSRTACHQRAKCLSDYLCPA